MDLGLWRTSHVSLCRCACGVQVACKRASTCSSSSSDSAADDSTICNRPSGAAPAPAPALAPAPARCASRACTSVAVSTASSPSPAGGSSAAAAALRSVASSAFRFLAVSRSWRTSATSSCHGSVLSNARFLGVDDAGPTDGTGLAALFSASCETLAKEPETLLSRPSTALPMSVSVSKVEALFLASTKASVPCFAARSAASRACCAACAAAACAFASMVHANTLKR
eukprot:scaffold133438_cov71-Phaeocystis_antarctica.AAC.1